MALQAMMMTIHPDPEIVHASKNLQCFQRPPKRIQIFAQMS